MRSVLLAGAIAAVAISGASAQNTFCERYAGLDAAAQYTLVTNVVTRAVVGGAASGGTAGMPVGLVAETLNKGYFNGTLPPNVDYTTNTAAFNTLATHLFKFFTFALGCRNAAGNATYAWNPVQMYSLHSAMKINQATMTAFIGQVATSVASFGVPLGVTTDSASEVSFLLALLSQFGRYTTTPSASTLIGGNAFQICTQADCGLAQQITQFHVNADNSITNLGGGSNTVTINQGDYVNFAYATGSATSGVTEAASATATTAKASGMASATGSRIYTTQMNTPGTYYFYSNGNTAARAQVTVTGTTTSTGTTMGSSSTGKNAASSSATLGFATVLAVAAAAAAIVA